MITAEDICKDYHSETGHGWHRVLSGVSFTVSPGEKVAVLGRKGAGKSTLIRLIAGVELPTLGTIDRQMTVSWPVGLTGGIGGSMTGNDNIRMICRLYNKPFPIIRDYVEDFAQLGKYLSEPVRSYSAGMRARLNFAVSLAIDFDCYLVDEIISVGDQRFQRQSYEELFERRVDRLCQPRKLARRAIRPRGFSRSDDGRCRAAGRADAVGHRGRGHKANH